MENVGLPQRDAAWRQKADDARLNMVTVDLSAMVLQQTRSAAKVVRRSFLIISAVARLALARVPVCITFVPVDRNETVQYTVSIPMKGYLLSDSPCQSTCIIFIFR